MQVHEYKGRVTVNGHKIIGHKIIGHITDMPCPQCGQRLVYADKYDANLCPTENIWTDSAVIPPTLSVTGG